MKNVKNVYLSLVVIVCSLFLVACSSKRNVKKDAITYTLSDMSTNGETPDWVFDGTSSKWEKDKEYAYFIGEDDNIDRLLCQKGASANATEKVVEQISQEIKSKYTKNVNSDNDNLDKKVNAEIAHQIESKLGGIERSNSYWEQRNYQKKLGADKNKKVFFCWQVVKVKKSTIQELSESVTNATVRVNNNKQ